MIIMDFKIKQEIKEEPPEINDDSDFEDLLVPKIELEEDRYKGEQNSSLSCPKCDITYYSAMSIKNHIQVCKKVRKLPLLIPIDSKNMANIKTGDRKKLTEDERRSIRILEQSCFVNEKNQMIKEELETKAKKFKEEEQKPHFCKECEVGFECTSNFARHLYAHTFIKVEDEDMPCICIDCGLDFEDKRFLALHLEEANCSGSSKVLFPCGLCKKIFTRKDNLRDDLRNHIDIGRMKAAKRQYKCKKCNKEYGGQTILTIHHLSHKRKLLQDKKQPKRAKIKEEVIENPTIKIKEEPL